ncbi:MAG: PIN domain-containing protein [Rhodocyclales bacterium]|nr:PIN domain-containing protein [Rhodocyclales bacterium]
MIAVDTSILVHAHRSDSSLNEVAFRAVNALASGRETWAIAWPCIHEFLAVVTNPRTFRPPTTLGAALEQVEVWLASPSLVLLEETDEHWPVLADILRDARVTGGLVHDARIVALCRQHGVRELWTTDRDFTRFPGLATFNPLADDRVHEQPPAYAAAQRARAAGRRRTAAPSITRSS